jgi:hypothetical protein
MKLTKKEREQLADALLDAARCWQNETGCDEPKHNREEIADLFDFACRNAPRGSTMEELWLHEAGVALSAVIDLGEDFE